MITCHPTRVHQRGVSLIEALITAVILAVGLLSVAAMQAKALQVSHLSYQRSVAVVQAHDAVERLWAGICYLTNENDDLEDRVAKIEDDWVDEHKDNTSGMDMDSWVGTIDIDIDNDRLVTVTITWSDHRVEDSPLVSTFEYSTILPNPKLIGCE